LTTNPSIFVESSTVISNKKFKGNQHILRLLAPKCATSAKPGQFVQIQCGSQHLLKRPLSLQLVSKSSGWIEILFRIVGSGTTHLATLKTNDTVEVMGPIGKEFQLQPQIRKYLLIGGGVGIPPMIFAAHNITKETNHLSPFVIMGSETPFPFNPKPSQFLLDGIPNDVIAAMPLLESWGVPSRLTSLTDMAGCHQGYVTDLARLWLTECSTATLKQIIILSCGPTPMLKAVASLAREFNVDCQVSLEEYMACAVGGCAGCVVPIKTTLGISMKRVCVDGPVFNANDVFFE
jgi:dihydroorotate dehydrogenase electron transfer subunit